MIKCLKKKFYIFNDRCDRQHLKKKMTDNNRNFNIKNKVINNIKNNFMIAILIIIVLFNIVNNKRFSNKLNILKLLQFIMLL